jgi:histone acetyltransferase (RNA polymerase elongator complex component)
MEEEAPSPSSARELIEAALSHIPSQKKKGKRQVAFYGGSFTAMDLEDQGRYLEGVQPFCLSGRIDSLRISTRPDALSEDSLDLLKRYGVETVEIGAQSMINEVLSLANRGHRAEDTVSAAFKLRQWGFEVGIQLMIGLPGDSLHCFLETLDRIIDIRPDFVRIHPTLVLRGAPLENLWRMKRYLPLSLEETIRWLKRGMLKMERAHIPVARVGLQPTRALESHLLAGPYHPALRQLVESAIAFDMAVHLLEAVPPRSEATFLCHPKELSNLRGQRNENIRVLRERFHLNEILIRPDDRVSRGSVLLQLMQGEISIHRIDLP